ncbi:unnamed protein product [Danaus chrysippus]|uniref:(African queen) hypothetical protein n=1 Tax=Danaus chrysippus TaxID=151541 RepID=A0A8J2MGR7_9NEOP|nr:unnamed protein product [Danaus chrysippus]
MRNKFNFKRKTSHLTRPLFSFALPIKPNWFFILNFSYILISFNIFLVTNTTKCNKLLKMKTKEKLDIASISGSALSIIHNGR